MQSNIFIPPVWYFIAFSQDLCASPICCIDDLAEIFCGVIYRHAFLTLEFLQQRLSELFPVACFCCPPCPCYSVQGLTNDFKVYIIVFCQAVFVEDTPVSTIPNIVHYHICSC
ncbi:unnamed protein product [Callosobruchus maculatus]|uniref:Uncharacterized protein n=1 Tax=Callosobruchus maculatus TaxID=64391 RepID=A0A653CS55_CALMS|nr:unnamed protein product [Callosobruchus maculatus]